MSFILIYTVCKFDYFHSARVLNKQAKPDDEIITNFRHAVQTCTPLEIMTIETSYCSYARPPQPGPIR